MAWIGNVVVGFDGSPDAYQAVQWAARLSVAVGAELTVVHAVGLLQGAGLDGPVLAHREGALRASVDAGLDPSSVRWSVVDGDPCSALLRATTGPVQADLVVVGSRGAGGGSALGSTSLELAGHSRVPVVVVPMPGESA